MGQRLFSLTLCLTLGGCSLLFEPGDEPGTGPVGSCSKLGAFGSPTQILFTGIAGAEEPTLSGDLLEIVFDGREEGGDNTSLLFSATRNSLADEWDAPRKLTEISLTDRESNPALSADGRRLRFCAGSPYHIYTSPRLANGGFGLPVLDLMPEVDASCPGWINEQETFMVFDVGLADAARLFVTRRDSPDELWGEPTELTGEPLPSGVGSPSYLECAGELWFHGAEGLYAAKWNPTEDSLGEIRFIGDFNDTLSEELPGNPWLSKNGKRLYFSVRADGGKMYEATRE